MPINYALRQVLINLSNNAVKFTERGNVTLSVNRVKTDGNKLLIHFSIADTGIGIEPKDYKDLFKPFTQANTDYTRKHDGMGLGLAICKETLELMGSEIKVESALNKGTVFTFEVWVEHAKKLKQGILENLDLTSDKYLARLARTKVLVVEDDSYNQIVIQKMLENQGVRVTLADSGQAAIRILQQSNFNLILMDIQMPDQDGFETTRLIRSNPDFTYTPDYSANGSCWN